MKQKKVDIEALSNDKIGVEKVDKIASVQETHFYADTGNLILNFVLSKNLLGGFPVGVSTVGGWVGTGKTALLLNVLRRFKIKAERTPNSKFLCHYYDTEIESFDRETIFPMLELTDMPNNFTFEYNKVEHFDKFAEMLLTTVIRSDADYNLILLDSFASLTQKQLQELEQDRRKVLRDDELYELETQQLLLKQRQIINLITEFIDLFNKKNIVFILTTHLYENINTFIVKEELKGGNYIKYISKNIIIVDRAKKKDNITRIVKDRSIMTLNFDMEVRKNRLGFEGAQVKLVGLPIVYDPYSGILDFLSVPEESVDLDTEDFETHTYHPLPVFYKKARKYILLPHLKDTFLKYYPSQEIEHTPEKWIELIQQNIKTFSDFLKELKTNQENRYKTILNLIDY